MDFTISRRALLQGSGAAAAGLIVGFNLGGPAAAGDGRLNTWVVVAPDGTVRILIGYSEMGQGIVTSLPQVIADEMEADFDRVEVLFAPAGVEFANPVFNMQGTGGSTTTRGSFEQMRKAGAMARDLLEQAAAARWFRPPALVRAKNGRLHDQVTGATLDFGEVALAASRFTPRPDYPLKTPSEWRYIGRAMDRLDIPAKVSGKAVFGIDVKVPNMLVATLAHCPSFGGTLKSVDPAPAMAVRGVRHVVPLDDAVVVVADGYWPAKKGLEALSPEWDLGAFADGSSAAVLAEFREALDEDGATASAEGDVEGALGAAAKTVEAIYEAPYLAHATMEPMNATAWVTEDRATVWTPTQGQGPLTMFGAQALGLDPSRITVHTTFLGGGFGRRFELDFSLKAMLTSRAVGAPVKLIWSREEDMRRDYYRPGAVARMTMGLDGDGMPTGFSAKLVCSSIMSRVFPQMVRDGIDNSSVEGISELPYALPARRIDYVMRNTDIPVGFWRSVGNSQNGWFAEAFIDEAATAAGKDAYAFRMALLQNAPRHARVLKTAAEAAGWGKADDGRHQGIALVESFGSIVAEVVELSVTDDKEIVLHKITVAADSGQVVDPRNFEAQLQSAIVYGLTAAFYGEIRVENGGVVEGNFDSYRMMKLEQMPAIVTRLIPDGTSAMGGAGEIATPPITPVLTNALFAATGERIRDLPLIRHGYDLGRARA